MAYPVAFRIVLKEFYIFIEKIYKDILILFALSALNLHEMNRTMKFFLKICCMLGIVQFASAQITLQPDAVTGDAGDTVLVPVKVTGFTKITYTQYSFHYDSNVVELLGIVKTTAYKDLFSSLDFGPLTVKGRIGFNWEAEQGIPQTIANGTVLFNFRFRLIGEECDSTSLTIANTPTRIEAGDENLDPIDLTSTTGKVKINGANCPGGPPPDTTSLQIIASTETTPAGVVKCIKVTTKAFKNIQTGQFTIHWNRSVALFDTVNSGAWTMTWGQNYAALADRSGVGITWDAGRTPLTLPDDAVLFEVCLRPVGSPGTSTDVTFDGNPIIIEFTDGNTDPVNARFTSGKLTITDAPAQTLKLYVRDTMVEEGTEFCIPIRVDNFTCVQNFQFSVLFDTSKLKFKRISTINLPSLGTQNFNVANDSVRVTWDASTGPQDLPNGGSLFSICFESLLAAPNCPFDTKLRFADLLGSPVEFSDCNSNNFTVVFEEPEFTVKCRTVVQPVVISLGTKTNIKCFGDCNGSVVGTQVSGGKGPFDYEWQLQPSGVVSTVLEPADLCPGDYRLVVIDRGNNNARTSSVAITISGPAAPIECSAVVTHVQTVNDGKIDLTVTGGTPPYTFTWYRLPKGPNPTRTEEDPANLPAASYEVTIRDNNGCVKVCTFTVNPAPIKIAAITELAKNKCFGDCEASLNVSASGGAIPYKLAQWSNGDFGNIADSLCAGTYTVTVTDANNNTDTGTYTVTQPDEIVTTLDSTRKSSGNDGAIYVTVKGGTPGFTYQWKNAAGAVVGNTEDLINIPPGTYQLCATDQNNCVKCENYICDPINTTPPTITVTLKIELKNGNQAVTCKGKCDGRITVEVTSSDPRLPYRYRWSHDSLLNSATASNLCPGISYRVTVTDAAGNSKVSNATVLPDAAAITLTTKRIKCASTSTATDGSYEALVSGAVLPVSYTWCNNSFGQVANDLAGGDCSVQIVDANGCTASENFTVCIGTSPNADCFKGRLAISPNSDGLNDFLDIACAVNFENTLTIFDRWGNQVFAANNYNGTWAGTDEEGNELTEGTYMWILQVRESGADDRYFKGTVTIVR